MKQYKFNYNPNITWTSEQVQRGDLKPNIPHYPSDPHETNCPPAGPRQFEDDELVWITYTSECGRRSFFRPECYWRPVGQSGLSILRGIVNHLGPDCF